MFKATFTKIKRACVIALVPRIVRGDGRYTTRKFGKTSINVLRKAGKSTDSGSKDGESECDKSRRFIDFVFGQSKPKTNTHICKEENKTPISSIREVNKEDTVQSRAKTKTRSEKHNRLLREFFGADEGVVRQDNFNKNLRLQAAAVDKHKFTQNKESLNDENLDTRQSFDMSQSERHWVYDNSNSKLRSETVRDNEKDFPADEYERNRSNPRDTEIPDHITAMNYKLQATTAKEGEENLTQKIEDFEETPLVQASPSKVEGTNIQPKVLGDQFINFSDSTKRKSKPDFQESLDEIATKCMDEPASQIDKKLMREMEKLGIANTDEQKSMNDEDVVRTDILKKAEKPPQEVEIDLDNREDRKKPIYSAEDDKLGPSFEMSPHLDQGGASTKNETESASYNKMQMYEESGNFGDETKRNASTITVQACLQDNVDLYDSRPQYDINQPIIDPYDKKTLAFDNYELDEAVMDSKLLDEQRIGKPSENEESQGQSFVESYVTSSEATSITKQESREPIMSENTMHQDEVQLVYEYDTPREHWRPYLSFEAREEVMDFYTQHNEAHDTLRFAHTESTYRIPSEPAPEPEKSYEPQPDHIYTSTSVPSESREKISHSFVQPEEMINPLMDKSVDEPKDIEEQKENIDRNLSEAFEPLPSLNHDGNVSLTELLKRVRMRNRLEYCREFALHTLNVHAPETQPTEGKCGKKSPPCPPPPPKCPPPSPCPPRPPACPPPPPPYQKPCKPVCPRPCPSTKKNPCNKFKKKCSGTSIREVLTLLTQNNPQIKIPQKYLLPILAYNAIRIPEPSKSEEEVKKEDFLSQNLVFRLSVLGKILLFHCTEAIDGNLPRNRSEMSFARDFEPWTPIPSCPIPNKAEEKRFVCPKEGCKLIPPPKLNNPCKENPCLNFPKRSNFSLTDLFSFSLVESLVYHTA